MLATDPLVQSVREWLDVFMRRSMRDMIRYSKQSGLSMSQLGTLFQIYRHGGVAVSDIGESMGVTNAAASQMIDRLVLQGFITRTEDPRDRRSKQIVLTEKGRLLLVEGMHARQAWLDELSPLFTPEERELIISALALLISKINQLEAQPEV